MKETKTKAQEKPVGQVFQGKFMRENSSFWDKVFYSYAKPLLDSSKKEPLRYEQFGDLPERLLIKHEEKKIEESIKHYIAKDPNDRFAFMKGLLAVNKKKFAKFLVIRILLQIDDFLLPFMVAKLIDWIQSAQEEPLESTLSMVALAISMPALQCLVHTVWEYFCFEMIEVGHRAHTALKVMLFRKNFKMTGATNKDFASGEIHNIIMDESDRIWSFIWTGPDYFQCAIQLVFSTFICFQQIGYCGLVVLLFTALNMLMQHARSKTEHDVNEKKRGKSKLRSLYINESFNNIKTVKLFGWETDFIQKIDKIYKEELELEDKTMFRAKGYDCLNHFINCFRSLTVFSVYIYMGNTLTLSQLSLTSIMLGRIQGRIGQCQHLYKEYFHIKKSMERLWQFYTAPESQKGLICKTKAGLNNSESSENALTIKGNFSWGVTPKLDQADKDKIKEKLRKQAYKKKTNEMYRVTKSLYDMMPKREEDFIIPLKERSLDQIINLKDIDISVKKGSFVVIIGETGAGKTTLLNSMIGELIYLPDQVIKEIGDSKRLIKDGELRYIEDTLLATDLSENSPVYMEGSAGYCEQQAWIQNGKLRDQILFGSDFDKRTYVETVMGCQLEPDLAIMPAGDQSEIGEKGINLSGGQKARVALARAIYKRPDVLIMDDPISALDANVRKQIFDQVFCGLMKEKTRILVTHAVDFIHLADHIIIMKEGRIEAQGSYDSLESHPYLAQVQDIHTKNKREIQQANELDSLKEVKLAKKTKSVQQQSLVSQLSNDLSEQPELKHKTSHNCDSGRKRVSSTTESTSSDRKDEKIVDPLESQRVDLCALKETELDEKLDQFKGLDNEIDENLRKHIGKLLDDDDETPPSVDKETYQKILKLYGGKLPLVIFVFYQLFTKFWDNYNQQVDAEFALVDKESQAAEHTNYLMKAAFVSSIGVLMHQFRSLVEGYYFHRIGNDMVKSTVGRVLTAPVNLFFDVTPIGKILKIFNQEIHVFRGGILHPIMGCVEMSSHVIVVLSAMFVISSWQTLIGVCIIALIFCKLVPYWFNAQPQLDCVASTIWGPIHSYFYECMRGTTLIRAFGQEDTIMEKQHYLLDRTTTHFIAHHSCWQWYNLRMMYATKLFQVLAIILIAQARIHASTMTLVLLFNWTTDMRWLMHFTSCINHFTHQASKAQKVFNLQNLPQEKIKGSETPPKEWGSRGEIEFKNINLRYRPNTQLVLKDVSFKVEPGQKVGVVGRTGAGKSTLCMAMTRIVELESGSIIVDDQDISKVDIKTLRDQITMIPQDPTLFTGSLRFNLDPFDQNTDERLMSLVKKAGLEYLLEGTSKQELADKKKNEEKEAQKKEIMPDIESDNDDADADKKKEDESKVKDSDKKEGKEGDKAEKTKAKEGEKDDKKDDEKKEEEDDGKGLKFKIQEEGKNLSVGERQLICIIRAILRCNKLVILDEATANIDVVTEQAIQKLIKQEFEGATVLTIAHRLNTIISSDRVLFLSHGSVLEYGSPKELLADPDSAFTRLTEDKKRHESKEKSKKNKTS